MPRLEFKRDNVKETNTSFPKIKLKKDEKARIIAIEPSPNVEFVHTLRKPKIVNGVPKTITKYRKDDTPYEDYEYEFIGTYICLGDLGTLMSDGEDPKSCPMCKMGKESDMVEHARRRFAMHVIKYATKNGSHSIATPFSVTVLAWAFTDKVFNQLVELAEEWDGDLRKHDLMLTCTNEVFQNYDFSVAQKAEWLADDARKSSVLETYKENQAKDLSALAGRKVDIKYIERDLDTIVRAWNVVNGTVEVPSVADDVTADFTAGLEGLLEGGQTLNDEGNITQSEFPETSSDDDAPAAKPAKKEKTETDDFDSLLAGLDD